MKLVCAIALLLLATPGLARAETVSSLPTVAPALTPQTQRLLPQARAIMDGPGTVWTKASAVRSLVRRNVTGSCDALADAYWRLGLAVGLKIRRLQLSANGANGFDTHVTTEVWLPGSRIWSLSDPTFDGWWSDNLSPVGAYAISARLIQYRVRHGQADALVWHQGGSLVLTPWSYYTDIRYAFRVLDYLLFVRGTTHAYVVDDPTSVAWPDTLLTSANLTLLPPDGTASAVKVPLASPTQAVADFPTSPPPYGASLVATLHVTTDAAGNGAWSIPALTDRLGFVIVRGAGSGTWTLRAAADYAVDALGAGVRLSPVVYNTGGPLQVVGGPKNAHLTIEAWLGRRMPPPS